MNVNAAGGFFRGYYASGSGRNRAGTSSPLANRGKTDQVMLSKQVLAALQLQNRLRAIEQARENAETSPEAQALDSMQKALEVMKACNKIAARIQAGDKVPLKDLQYLMKNDPQGYQLAMASRKPKEDPKEWKSAVPEEEQEHGRWADAAGEQTDGVQACSGSGCSSGLSPEGGSSDGAGTGADSGGI